MSRTALLWAARALLVGLFVPLSLWAQFDTGQISGFVRDATGSVIPGADITVTNEGTGLERRVVSNDTGYYVAPNLPPGTYTVVVEVPGFKRFVSTGHRVAAGLAVAVNASLQVGEVTEIVNVVASSAAVQSDTATVGRVIETTEIQNLALSGRNPIFLAALKAGVRRGSLDNFSYAMDSGGFAISGSRSQDNLISVDGAVATRTRARGTSIGSVDLESVQEMQVLTANYGAEYGGATGGQIRIITKSGGRDFHGSVYEYFRNDVLDANTWSRNRAGQDREALRFNQFGYIFSGPIFIPGGWNANREKLFFMWSQEWVRHRREQTSIQTVPSLAMREGDFSELLDPDNTFFGSPRVINDPETGEPFPNNSIPADRLSSNGLGLLRAYPAPTPGFQQGTNNFFQTRPIPTNQRKETLSIDWIINDDQTFRARVQNYNFTQLDAFRGGFDLAVTDWDRPNRTSTFNHIWTFSPVTVNELTVAASVDRVFIEVQREGNRFARSQFGIDYPYLFPERKEIEDKIPTIAVSNFATVDGGPYPAFSSGPIYTISDNLTRTFGNHTVKVGAMFERYGQNDFDQINVTGVPGGTNNQNGRFVFTDLRAGAATTGLAVANAAVGLFDTYAEIGPRAYTPYRANMFEWYIQDSWRATEKLRLELGVRHSVGTPYFYSLWGNMAAFDPSRYDPSRAAVLDPDTGFILSGDRFNGVVIPGTGWPDAASGRVAIADSGEFDHLFSGGDNYWGERQWGNFQPRIGIAYAINDETVIRAGGGKFVARPGVSDNIFLGGNPPFQPMVSIANGVADDPAGGQPSNFPQFFMTSDPVFKYPSSYNWSINVQREIGFETAIEIGYVGRVGLHLERERDLNQLAPGTLFLPENQGVNVNALRPFKGFAFIPMGETAARSRYNGLQIEATRRMVDGFAFGVAYTYSKSEDNASGRRERAYNALDDRNFWGPSGFDTRHVMVIHYIYELPFLRDRSNLTGKLLGGWQVSGVTQLQTGTPITIGTSDDFAGIGRADFVPWNFSGDPFLSKSDRNFADAAGDGNFYFRTTNADGSPIFTQPGQGTFGNQTRNQLLHNPGLQVWNLALFKDFAITEGQRFQVRAEAFNLPNHPNWGGATTNPRSASFGQVTSKSGNRNVQISLRYSF
jgi:hypothetical protein